MTLRLLAFLCAVLLALSSGVAQTPNPVGHTTEVIAALIDNAAQGDTVLVPAGIYVGNLDINKEIILDGQGAVTIDGGGSGTVVIASSPNVTFRGFTVRASGTRVDREPAGIQCLAKNAIVEDCRFEDVLFGIDLRAAPDSIIRRNYVSGKGLEPGRRGDGIRLWWSAGCVVEDNVANAVRDMVFWYSEDLIVRNNTVEHSRYGLHFMYSHNTILTKNVLQHNSVGIYLMYSNTITIENNTLIDNRGASGYGIGLKDCDDIIVRSNAILANRVGTYIDNSPSSVDATGILENNLFAYNERGMLMTPITHGNVFTGNGYLENEEQVAVHGRGDLTLNEFSRDGEGNYWSDYTGFDFDGDQLGDLPYESSSLFESLLARQPNLRLFIHSPAQQAIEFTARALPEIQPRPKFVDPSPRMSPPVIEVASATKSHPALMAAFSLTLIFSSLVLLTLLARAKPLPTLVYQQERIA